LNRPRYNAASCPSPFSKESHKLLVAGGFDASGVSEIFFVVFSYTST